MALTYLRRNGDIVTDERPRWNAMRLSDPPRKAVTRDMQMLSNYRARIEYHAL